MALCIGILDGARGMKDMARPGYRCGSGFCDCGSGYRLGLCESDRADFGALHGQMWTWSWLNIWWGWFGAVFM
jgi:hypothetical protein